MDAPSPQEAKEALALIEETTRRMRRAVAHGGAPYFLIIWGVVWLLGFGGAHFIGPNNAHTGWLWAILDTLGVLASFGVGWRLGRRVRSRNGGGALLGAFWLAWVFYAALIIAFARPQSGDQLSLLISLFAMMGYVTTGLLYRSTFITTLGMVVTLFILAGYLLFLPYFNLWMAFLGGGSLIVAGVYVLQTWR
ncbi:MAG: hypothetical protein D6770_08185 [Anaerolineae bacterium]|nr:MAG: hypothetical protein D6770_08185 [Anaerolineae bacterium]